MIENLKIKTLDKLAAAHLNRRDHVNPDDLLHGSKSQRAYAAINMANKIVPGLNKWLAEAVTHTEAFPFTNVENLAFAEGGENLIFLIENGQGKKYVVKVNKQSIGKNPKELQHIADQIQSDRETIQSWYPKIPKLVPPEHTIIIHSHVSNIPAIATIQEYMPEPWYDLFTSFKSDELLEFLQQNKTLRGHVSHFAQQTVERYHRNNRCIDLLGTNNVSFISQETISLTLPDPHLIFDKDFIATLPIPLQLSFKMKMDYLEAMANQL